MAGYVGLISETSWGVAAGAVDKFVPVVSSTLTPENQLLIPAGIRSGRRTNVFGRIGARKVKGQVQMELPNKTIATLLKHCFGAVNTTGAGPYTHTLTPGAQVGSQKSFTLATVVDDSGGTSIPFTALGAKIDAFEISCQAEQYAMLSFDWTAERVALHRSVADGVTTISDATVTSATANFSQADLFSPISGTGIPANSYIGQVTSATSIELSSSKTTHTSVNATASGSGVTLTIGIAAAAASYTSGLTPFTFVEATLAYNLTTIGSARSASLKGTKGLANDRVTLGKPFISEQLERDHFTYTLDLVCDFEATTGIAHVRNVLASGQTILGLTFSNGTDSLTVSGYGQPVGDLPSLTSIGLEEQAMRFVLGHDTSDASAITAVLVNTDTSAA